VSASEMFHPAVGRVESKAELKGVAFISELRNAGGVNAYEVLGLENRLVISEEVLREAFREGGKKLHPDAGGGEGEFTALREAFALLSSPSRRLRHWLDLRGVSSETRGAISPMMVDLFSEIGVVTQEAEALIRRRDEARTALGRAMLEGETQECRERVEWGISKVETEISSQCSVFSDYEIRETVEVEAAATLARNLAFLEKWRAGLRSCFARLI
jgi:curved DNA-binding protein CbpA